MYEQNIKKLPTANQSYYVKYAPLVIEWRVPWYKVVAQHCYHQYTCIPLPVETGRYWKKADKINLYTYFSPWVLQNKTFAKMSQDYSTARDLGI